MADLLTIGHVARDEFAGEADWRLGGTALYAAAAAARLGTSVALLTRVGPNERERLAARCRDLGIEMRALEAEATTTFAFRYVDGKRQLRLKARARSIGSDVVPAELRSAGAVVLASIAHELGRDLASAFAQVPRVLAAQGYLRTWDADGTIRRREWDDAADVLAGVSVAVVSEEDIDGDLGLARGWARSAAVAVTLAERGALLLRGGREVVVPGFPAERVVDPTGAGDAFCAGLAIALAGGARLEEAARFANAVASFAVEAVGVDGLGTREQVEMRMRGQGSPSISSSAPGKTAQP